MDKKYRNVISKDFDNLAPDYDNKEADSIIPFILSNLSKMKNNALDIGCGTGKLSNELSKQYNKVLGIDISENMIKKAKKKYKNVTFKKIDIANLKSKTKFDLIVSINTFHHLDLEKSIPKIKKLLNKNGKLIIIDIASELKTIKPILCILHRYYQFLINIFKIGFKKAIKKLDYDLRFIEHKKHDVYLTPKEFEQTYKKLLSKCKIEQQTSNLKSVIWTK